jgi:hypothetical protein
MRPVLRLAAGDIAEAELADWIERHTGDHSTSRGSSMDV